MDLRRIRKKLAHKFPRVYFYLKTLYLLKNIFFTPSLKSVGIEISSKCNRSCRYCPNFNFTREVAFLKESLFYKIINELKKMGFKGTVLFNLYNEPLLDKRIIKFLEYTKKILPHAHTVLYSNGDLLNFDLWQKLRKAGLDFANITQYDGKINENIVELLNKINAKEKECIDISVFDPKNACNGAGLIKLEKVARLPLKRRCFRPFTAISINHRGKAILCCNDYLGKIEMGDLHKDLIKDVWKNKKFVYYRRNLFFGNRAYLELCRDCDVIEDPFPLTKA